ncbi:MAG: o-succinylbenzoate synthase [Bacillota bacterium]|uniref:o-succinylbenzoate synthase n=1 Tax=Virgibacillus salarius TaxID=447199 RepID=A0A941I9W0_9BACI|nr:MULTISPECIES: o-succinylbenzoate synthase [Bacillaceae]NAZ08690.1 o-succinylbenzoate synthase [Agaribacter marinus]MBR7795978.1 o-succinylbenzoate synthase [Virgibacillus salarius]MCC2249963.1 o-succinylbenzoate synthase [Virgibacillus sp. AGTR]MDY7044126.1 o-succinylbenzoate synthase [Virgibacillus sp. M23]QRZ18218.1 o-succinylbenzoate synthase [Virgibacillus sp. AGTR]
MRINEVVLYKMQMQMKNPFTTSFGTEQNREFLLVEVKGDDGISGWGEGVTSERPLYSEEFTLQSWYMLEKFLIPLVVNQEITHPDDLQELFKPYKRNHMAKSALEGAVWDLYAKQCGESLATSLGGTKKRIEVGISLGIEDSYEKLIQAIQEKVDEGYKRIKIKIKPGKDIEVLREVRKHFPNIPLMVDANSAYTLDDINLLKALDEFNLMMIEQPLTAGDLIDHAKLQKQINTPICLDESIHSFEDARQAIELGSCKIINLKIGRVGGLTASKRIHDLCENAGIPLWCGGMLESGVGRAHNIAVAALANFTLPGDTASSSRYWEKDIIQPEVVAKNGVLTVQDAIGIGYEVDRNEVKKHTVAKKVFS